MWKSLSYIVYINGVCNITTFAASSIGIGITQHKEGHEKTVFIHPHVNVIHDGVFIGYACEKIRINCRKG